MIRLALVAVIISSVAQTAITVAMVSLTQETPCLSARRCRLKCSVVSGTNDNGLLFVRGNLPVVSCPGGRDNCRAEFPDVYSHTQVDYSTSYVDIRSFNASFDAGTWNCWDGATGTPSSLQVVQNVLPTGSLTYGSTCVSGRATSPASLSCSGLSPGAPPATLSIVDFNNASAGSSPTGSVTGTVTRGGHASCFVTWSAFPSYSLNIRSVLCDVQVASSITLRVTNITARVNVITCQAQGHPDTYTFQPWLQSWGGQEVRRVTGSQQGGQYSLTLTSYQDSGTYTCSVDNRVLDSSGQVIQTTANISVTVEDAPVLILTPQTYTVYRETGERVHLSFDVFASPALTYHTWFFNSTDVTSLVPGATTNRSRDMVLLPVHGTTVTTEGTVINLYLTVSQQYSGLYRLQACNRIDCTSANVSMMIASSPHLPENLIGVGCTGMIVLIWTPGFAGGDFFQWFHVQYRRQDSQEGQWSDVSTAYNRSSSDRTLVTVTVQGLQPDTSYVFRVRAQSSRPQRNLSNYTAATVTTNPVKDGLYPGSTLAAAVVVTAVLAAAVAVATTCVVQRLRRNSGTKGQNASAEYQNVAYRGQDTHQNIESSQGRAHAGTEPTLPKEEGAYSVLDPASRDLSRDPSAYQGLTQSGLHGNQQSRDTGNHGNQTYSNVPAEGPYAMPYDVTD